MAIEEPDGPVSEPIEQFRAMLAESPAWRQWIGGTPEDADAHLYETAALPFSNAPYTRAQIEALRPFGIVNILPSLGVEMRMAASDTITETTRVEIEIQANISPQLPYREVSRAFNNRMGRIMRDLYDLSLDGSENRPFINRIYTTGPICRCDPDVRTSEGDYLFLRIVGEVGVRAGR
ncbi:MAG TPA: hypothetical protein VGN72_19730 [Tepidisphaeraceae bacterium]|jgi:hypothetical protein|nr:hypothetical protein [Tepidisphaeraceae bacterium]